MSQYVPHAKQKTIHDSTESLIMVIGGYQSGKSLALFSEVKKQLSEPDSSVFVAAPAIISHAYMVQDGPTKIPGLSFRLFDAQSLNRVFGESGTELNLRSPENYSDLDLAIKPNLAIFDECDMAMWPLAFHFASNGSRVIWAFTPPASFKVVRMSTYDNPHLTPESIQMLEKELKAQGEDTWRRAMLP